MSNIRGKSLKAIARDVAEGYVTINPIFLKPIAEESLTVLFHELQKCSIELRGDKFPHNDIKAIRWRNLRLQRLHTASIIIKNYARQKRIRII